MSNEVDFNQMYENIRKLIDKNKNNILLFEEEINVEIQAQYFNLSKTITENNNSRPIENLKDDLFAEETSLNEKKKILINLAKSDSTQAYRTIEEFVSNCDNEIKKWAKLALHESKMSLQNSILGTRPIVISTGLGGRGFSLRYFIVIIPSNNIIIDDIKFNLVEDELQYALKHKDGELESFILNSNKILITLLLPIVENIKDLMRSVIEECNSLGHFLEDKMIITNVKRLSIEEINELIRVEKNPITNIKNPNDKQ